MHFAAFYISVEDSDKKRIVCFKYNLLTWKHIRVMWQEQRATSKSKAYCSTSSSAIELTHLQFVFQILHLFPRLIYFKTWWNYLDHPVWPPVLRTSVWQEAYFPERHAVWEGYFQLWYVSVVIVYAIEIWGADVSVLPRYTTPPLQSHCMTVSSGHC